MDLHDGFRSLLSRLKKCSLLTSSGKTCGEEPVVLESVGWVRDSGLSKKGRSQTEFEGERLESLVERKLILIADIRRGSSFFSCLDADF